MAFGALVGFWLVVVFIWEAVTDFLPVTRYVVKTAMALVAMMIRTILGTL